MAKLKSMPKKANSRNVLASKQKQPGGQAASKGSASSSRQSVPKLAAEYLKNWSAGMTPDPQAYLACLTSEADQESFKQSVAMGMLLKQALA